MNNSNCRGFLRRFWLAALLLFVGPLSWFSSGPCACGDEPVIERAVSRARWRLGFFRRSTFRPGIAVRSDRRRAEAWRAGAVVESTPVNELPKGAERPAVATPVNELAKQAERPGVAKCVSETGTIIRREAMGKPWQVVAKNEALHAGDLVIGLPGAAVQSNDGKASLAFRPDLTGQEPLPIIETAVIFHESKDDLELTLDRGRVVLTNTAKEGPVRVRLRIRDKTGVITLKAPESRLGIEMFGRWPAGSTFHKEGGSAVGPALNLICLVFHGEVDIKTDRHQFAMTAPKGPAMLTWDSVTGHDAAPQYLEQLPDWAKQEEITPQVREKMARRDELIRLITTKSIPEAIETFLNSDDPEKRRIAVFAMGATDDLRGLGKALAESKHLDIWNNAVIAMRHWLGRGPGQDMKLYNGLIKEGKYKPIDAEAVIQLLHGFTDADLGRPETYEMLIDYLSREKLPLRGLAYWHLYRLVPAGRKLGYNPLDEKDKRQAAIAKWQKLVPRGELPAPGKTSGN
jgi:hypothetical protein